jgi:hypothetical protein
MNGVLLKHKTMVPWLIVAFVVVISSPQVTFLAFTRSDGC